MKTTLILISAFLALNTHAQTDPLVASNIKKYTSTWDAILNEGKTEFFNSENFSPDVVQFEKTGDIVGIPALKEYYSHFLIGFPDLKFGVKDIFGQGNKLVKYWTFEGTHTGEFFGMPATGRRLVLEGSSLIEMRDGKVISERNFFDNMDMFSQLGMVSDPGNMAVVDGLYKAFAKGDIPTALSTMDPKIIWNEAESFPYADRNPYVGPDAVLQGVFARLGADWEYWNLTGIELHEMSNNQVLSTLRYQAKCKKNGAEIDAQVAHLFTLKDGKITNFQQFTDTKQVAEAMIR